MCLHADVSLEELKVAAQKFVGKIEQLPPVRSSVKRALRIREVKSFEILEKTDKDVLFKTTVQAGTYIRKLIHDIGRSLPVQSSKARLQDLPTSDRNRAVGEQIGGAHMLELRRTKAGIFSEEDNLINMYDFDKLVDELKKGNEKSIRKVLFPAEEAIKKVLPFVQLSDKNLKKILTGKPLMKEDLINNLPKEEKFSAFIKERFIGVYHKVNEEDIIAKAEFIYN